MLASWWPKSKGQNNRAIKQEPGEIICTSHDKLNWHFADSVVGCYYCLCPVGLSQRYVLSGKVLYHQLYRIRTFITAVRGAE